MDPQCSGKQVFQSFDAAKRPADAIAERAAIFAAVSPAVPTTNVATIVDTIISTVQYAYGGPHITTFVDSYDASI